jgi:SAM-dependent methyltransferase
LAPNHEQPSLEAQRAAWNSWNAATRETRMSPVSVHQARVIENWLNDLRRPDGLDLLDAGCGSGWMAERLLPFGRVTGVDLADEVVARAAARVPGATFLAGDFATVPLPLSGFDVIVALELLSHVSDQPALMTRFASLLRPGGSLLLATQNRPILERWSEVGPPAPGHLRRWVDAGELRALLGPEFRIRVLTSVMPVGDRGYLQVVNSFKLNRLLGAFLGPARVEQAKENLLLGHTLMVRAERR